MFNKGNIYNVLQKQSANPWITGTHSDLQDKTSAYLCVLSFTGSCDVIVVLNKRGCGLTEVQVKNTVIYGNSEMGGASVLLLCSQDGPGPSTASHTHTHPTPHSLNPSMLDSGFIR